MVPQEQIRARTEWRAGAAVLGYFSPPSVADSDSEDQQRRRAHPEALVAVAREWAEMVVLATPLAVIPEVLLAFPTAIAAVVAVVWPPLDLVRITVAVPGVGL